MFVGKDVAQALGYSDSNKAIRIHVDDEDKGGAVLSTPVEIRKLSLSTNLVSTP